MNGFYVWREDLANEIAGQIKDKNPAKHADPTITTTPSIRTIWSAPRLLKTLFFYFTYEELFLSWLQE